MLKVLVRRVVLNHKKQILAILICALLLSLFTFNHSSWVLSPITRHCACHPKDVVFTYNTAKNHTNTNIVNKTKTNKALVQIDTMAKNESQQMVGKKTNEKPTSIPNNYVDFELVLPFIEPSLDSQQRKLHVAVVVNSAAKGEKHRNLRQTIRETWGNATRSPTWNTTLTIHSWKVFFSLGIADNLTEHEANLKEASEHNDIIIGNFTDTYRNVVIKTFMAHFWAVTKLSCNYVLKTDDDVYVRVPGLISWLIKSGSPKRFYGGVISKFHEIPRDPKSPWYISLEQYKGANWPPWCHGSYHVLSTDIIPSYLIYTYKRKPFHTDDAYIGVASKDLGVRVNQIPGFTVDHVNPRRARPEQELRAVLTIGHRVTAEDMLRYYQFYVDNNLY